MRAGSSAAPTMAESNPEDFLISRMTAGSVSTHHGGSFNIKGLGAGYGFGRNQSIYDGAHIGDVEEDSNEMAFSGYEME